MKKKILLCSYGGGHINMLLPVYKKLINNPDFECHFFALTTAINTLEKNNIPYSSYRDLITEDDQDALKWGKQLLEEMGDSKVIPTDESIAYLGLSYKDLVLKLGEENAQLKYKEEGRHAFLQTTIADRILERWAPDLVITTNSPKTEEALVLQSRNKNISAAVIWDLFQDKDLNRLARPGYADKICVLSEKVKDKLMEKGRLTQEVAVTGNPAFDQLFDHTDERHLEATRFKKEIGFENKKIILWAQQNWTDMTSFNEEVQKKLIELSEQKPNVGIIFRPHPNDDRFKDFEHENLYISREPSSFLPTLLRSIDAALSINSTLILEASTLEIPSYTIEFTEHTQNLSFAKMGATEAINSFDDIEKICTKLTETSSQGQDTSTAQTERASDKVINAIQPLL